MSDRRTQRTRERDLTFPLQLGGAVLGIVVLFVGLPYILLGHTPSAESNANKAVAASVAAPAAVVPAAAPVAPAAKPVPEPIAVKKPAPKPAAKKPAPKPKPKPAVDKVAAYRGLGAWVDIFDDPAWADPAATVRDMASHGVKTLYIETSNSRQSVAIKDVAKMETFIRTAHANKMKVVAWYLPDFKNEKLDNDRIAAAIRFHTRDGQSFDSFTLDIENPSSSDITALNAAVFRTTVNMRKVAGWKYPIGACIQAPAAMAQGAWPDFPYPLVGKYYDAVVPMSYYTYHQRGYANVYADTVANIKVLKSNPATAKMPIHMIGGETQSTTVSELQAFLSACRQWKIPGASIYEWQGTTSAIWQQLATVK